MKQRTGSKHERWTRLATDQRGMVLVVALLLMSLLALMGLEFLTTSATEHQIARNDQEVIQALYVAEAGIQTVLNDLNRGLTPTTAGSVGPGVFTATVTNAPPPAGQQQIVATGYIPTQAAPRAVRQIAVLVIKPSPSLFRWAAFGGTLLKLSSAGTINSYNSQSGSYGGGNVGSKGHAGSNGNVDLTNDFTVNGDATAGGIVTNPTRVTGTSTNGAPPESFPTVDCPAGGYTPSVPPGPGVSYSGGVLKITGGGNLTLSAPGTYYFRDVTVSSGATLTIASGGHVDIYVDRKVDFTGGGLVNTTSRPTDLTIWGCGTDTTGWALNSGQAAYVAIYTPTHKFTVGSTSDLYGSLIAANIDVHGNSNIHYDEALGGSADGKYVVVKGSWTERSY